jgi:fatty-acyl-CoA synthase
MHDGGMLASKSGDRSHSSADAWRRALERTAPIAANPSRILPVVIDELAVRFGEAPALLSDRENLTFQGLAARAQRYARWARDQSVAKGDVVCLLMPNCPDYMAIWLGLTRIGGVVALVNTNLTGDALLHSLTIVAPNHIIVGVELAENLAAVRAELDPAIRLWARGGDAPRLRRIDLDAGAGAPEHPRYQPSIRDTALYIYTSGTTGLPKAAAVSHFRLMQWSHWFAGMMNTGPDDRMYNCLPLYHSIGGVVATGATLVGGGSVVIRERFSASQFWDDVARWDCTLFQYIGELCRYLVNAPPHPREAAHRLRLACGNGLRAEVWAEFQNRFDIPQIIEFYAATEGSFSLYNCDGKPGAIGRIPAFLAHRFAVALVKLDADTGEPERGADGFCVRCAAGEPGEAIGKIANDASGGGRFEGYTDTDASARKVLRDVFAAGDGWYRTGDLMRKDRAGYFYFVDRIGDTFRWKGENVSTTEVEAAIATCPGVAEVVVYGVAIPATDGRAGMAAIVIRDGFDIAGLHDHLAERLPDYARPMFLRILSEIAVTGTFKPQKQALARDGYDPSVVDDALYVSDRISGAFVRLDPALYRRIQNGELRF